MKRLMSLITTIAMAVCMIPTFAFASNLDADNSSVVTSLKTKSAVEKSTISDMDGKQNSKYEVKSTEYDALEDGETEETPELSPEEKAFLSKIESAATGATIYLDEDLTVYNTIYIDDDLTIDLNGHIIEGDCEDVFYISSGNVTIKNGEIASCYNEYVSDDSFVTGFCIIDSANVTLSDLEIYTSYCENIFVAVYAADDVSLNVKNCEISMYDSNWDACGIACGDNTRVNISNTGVDGLADISTCLLAFGKASVYVYNGNFWAYSADEDYYTAAIIIEDSAYVLVDRGYYECSYGSVYLDGKNSKLCIKRGEFSSVEDTYSAFANGYYDTYTSNVLVASGYTVAQNYISKWRKYGCEYVAFYKKPVATKIKKLKKGSKKLTAYWYSKGSSVSGYIVQVARNKSFTKGKKTVYVSGGSKSSKTITKLSKKKYYYVRVCTYKNAYGEKFLSSWSSVKKIKTR